MIGIKEIGSFHPCIIAEGNNTKKEIRMPLTIELIFHSIVETKIPITTHIESAEIFASQVDLSNSMGIMSITPAINPNKIPFFTFFIIETDFIFLTLLIIGQYVQIKRLFQINFVF